MESIAREIALCLRYHSVTFRGQRASRVRLLGGESGDPQLLAILNSTLAVKAVAGQPLLGVDCAAMHGFNPAAPSGEWALAFGLALKRVPGSYTSLEETPRKSSAVSDPPPTERTATQSTATGPTPARVEFAPPIEKLPQDNHFAEVRSASNAMEETHV